MRNQLTLLIASFCLASGGAAAEDQVLDPAADWPMYNRDLAGTRYSPLDQINTGNVGSLASAWTYRFNREGHKPISGPSHFELFQQITPIVVKGIMYLPAGDRVVALEPETGKEIWVHELAEGIASFRGVSYWPGDAEHQPRIFFTTARKMIALDAETGERTTGFGKNGEIDLGVAYSGAPAIYKNIIIVGANFFGPGETHIGPQLTDPRGEDGDSRAYSAITGEKLWQYNTIPGPGEPGHETWGKESWKDRTGNNVWAFALTVDAEHGIVYMPVSTPGANFYGGDRPGNNEPANSTVALDAETGKVKWYFQNIHHDLWDYNLPPAPSLFDLVKDGETIPALAQTGKSSFMFILNRLTGEPLFEVKETPVPAGNVPGEWYSPTQPIPVKPPPLARVSFTAADIVTAADTTAEHADACRALWEEHKYYNAGPYTPYNLKAEGTPPTLLFPTLSGGVNWGGTAVDPKLGYVFVNSKDESAPGWTIPNPRYNQDTAYAQVPYTRGSGPEFAAPGTGDNVRWPCHKPPWARLFAVNAATGDIAWEAPLGLNETLPEGKQKAGSPGYGGPMVTAGGLVFIGATSDSRFRAFDSRTGAELWAQKMDYNITAIPMTYQGKNRKQYVAVVAARAAGFGPPAAQSGPTGEGLFVFALP
ncbi:MAG: pyrroloquinoline quinone-dependent dehydrogenase [Gammaproteobacteria bacterium]|nr:MAG: pyrroloquinoline quinone-dependent dehydrogenase [Gammaproteobacteria bacterium]